LKENCIGTAGKRVHIDQLLACCQVPINNRGMTNNHNTCTAEMNTEDATDLLPTD